MLRNLSQYTVVLPGVLTSTAMVVFAEESDIGKASEEIECDYDGPDASLALNYVYLLDPLREMEAESLSIEFTEVNKAVTLKPFPEEDYLHIVMPMQTS